MRLNSRGEVLSARVVEPRTSAKRSEHSTSAPPWLLLSIPKQRVQYFGFLVHLAWPRNRMRSPPGPENGAAQSLHRGELGRLARNRRFLWNGAWSTSMLRHFSSDAVGGSEEGSVLGSPADPGISAILRRAANEPGVSR